MSLYTPEKYTFAFGCVCRRVSVNYTTTLSQDPNFGIASMNCAIGDVSA